jgi:hypothetical protein
VVDDAHCYILLAQLGKEHTAVAAAAHQAACEKEYAEATGSGRLIAWVGLECCSSCAQQGAVSEADVYGGYHD